MPRQVGSARPNRSGILAVASIPAILVFATSASVDDLPSALIAFAWGVAPIAIPLALLLEGSPSARTPPPSLGFLVGASVVTAAFHVAWLFDIAETATGSSTAGLAFIFIPFHAALVGAVSAALTFALGRRR